MLNSKIGIALTTLLIVGVVWTAPSKKDLTSLDLPDNSHPIHYTLDITTRVHTGDKKFEVVEEIFIEIDDITSSSISLHNKNLTVVGDIELKNKDGINIFKNVEIDGENDLMKINYEDPDLKNSDRVTLKISFYGYLQDNSVGFYISWYKENEITK